MSNISLVILPVPVNKQLYIVIEVSPKNMIGFHVDMNIAHFKADYLKKWLKYIAELGYDTVLWEVEANIKWDTVPQCSSPEAFTKEEFREILDYSRSLSLEPIPLLQTLGHCEYVLKNDEYKHLAELDGDITQYCPSNPEVYEFLTVWADEYIELFGDISKFHLGGDEAFLLGKCDKCSDYAKRHSLSAIYVEHTKKLCDYIIDKQITPAIWADMLLHYPEQLNKIPSSVLMFDWVYDNFYGHKYIWIHGLNVQSIDIFDKKEYPKHYDGYVYTENANKEKMIDPFFASDFLADNGFGTVTCPASSCYGDNVFFPRIDYHLRNTFDAFKKGYAENLKGSLLTSWTVHLFPWELQTPSIEAASYVHSKPEATLKDFKLYFVNKYFGTDDLSFFQACDLLSPDCLFSTTRALGFDKKGMSVSNDFIEKSLELLKEKCTLESELNNCHNRLKEYLKGLDILTTFSKKVPKGQSELETWLLAARNMVNRAEASICLLNTKLRITKETNQTETLLDKEKVLSDLKSLKKLTEKMYENSIKPLRRQDYIAWLFEAMEHKLST